MSKQTITVGGEDQVVREDTAKAFRGVHWALISVGAFLLIMLVLLLGGFLSMSGETGTGDTPYGRCVSICDEITDDRITFPSRTTAAAVSSHELSIPKISTQID